MALAQPLYLVQPLSPSLVRCDECFGDLLSMNINIIPRSDNTRCKHARNIDTDIRLSLYLFIGPPFCSVPPLIRPAIRPSISHYIRTFINAPVRPSFRPSVPPFFPSFLSFIYRSFRLLVRLFVSVFVFRLFRFCPPVRLSVCAFMSTRFSVRLLFICIKVFCDVM